MTRFRKATQELLKEKELLPNYYCRLYISVGIRNDTGKIAYLYVIDIPDRGITSPEFYDDYWKAHNDGLLRFDEVVKEELEEIRRFNEEYR